MRRPTQSLAKAFGDHLAEVRSAMEELAARYDPAEVNRIGFRLYEKFRPIPMPTLDDLRAVQLANAKQKRRPMGNAPRYPYSRY